LLSAAYWGLFAFTILNMSGSEVWVIIFLMIGAVLIFLEFITPTNFVLFAFGLGFFTLAGLTYVGLSLWVQILAFIFVVSLTIFLSYKFARKTTEGAKDFSPISVVGKEGRVVLVEGDKVVVRVEGEDWLAEGEGEFKGGDKGGVFGVLVGGCGVRVGNGKVEIITSVTSEFKKRGEEMYRKYADEISKVIMNGGDGVYLVVYPNYNMMISIANYLMNLPVRQVREGEVKHLPKLLELALTNKKLVIHAVSGGRFTEGVELVKDGKSLIKYIIIAGVLYPNISDDYVRDRIKASGLKDYTWMKIQAEMQVKQAIGRGIRGPEDSVNVILMDYRYSYLAKSWGLTSY